MDIQDLMTGLWNQTLVDPAFSDPVLSEGCFVQVTPHTAPFAGLDLQASQLSSTHIDLLSGNDFCKDS